MSWNYIDYLLGVFAAQHEIETGKEPDVTLVRGIPPERLEHVNSAGFRVRMAMDGRGMPFNKLLENFSISAVLLNRRYTPEQKQAIADEICRVVKMNAGCDWQYYARLTHVFGNHQKWKYTGKKVASPVDYIRGPSTARKQLRDAWGFHQGRGWWHGQQAEARAVAFLSNLMGVEHGHLGRVESGALMGLWMYQAGVFHQNLSGYRYRIDYYKRELDEAQFPIEILNPTRREQQVAQLEEYTKFLLSRIKAWKP